MRFFYHFLRYENKDQKEVQRGLMARLLLKTLSKSTDGVL